MNRWCFDHSWDWTRGCCLEKDWKRNWWKVFLFNATHPMQPIQSTTNILSISISSLDICFWKIWCYRNRSIETFNCSDQMTRSTNHGMYHLSYEWSGKDFNGIRIKMKRNWWNDETMFEDDNGRCEWCAITHSFLAKGLNIFGIQLQSSLIIWLNKIPSDAAIICHEIKHNMIQIQWYQCLLHSTSTNNQSPAKASSNLFKFLNALPRLK